MTAWWIVLGILFLFLVFSILLYLWFPRPYDVLLFDLDGTILNFEQTEHGCLKELCSRLSLPETEELRSTYLSCNRACWNSVERGEMSWSELRYHRFADTFEKVFPSGDPVKAEETYEELLSSSAIYFEDAKGVLERLSKHYRICFITNGLSRVQNGRLSASGLDAVAERIFISEDMGFAKPNPAFFDYVKEQIDVLPTRMLVIGDSLSSDIRGGEDAGIETCWINRSEQTFSGGVHPKLICKNLRQLERIL